MTEMQHRQADERMCPISLQNYSMCYMSSWNCSLAQSTLSKYLHLPRNTVHTIKMHQAITDPLSSTVSSFSLCFSLDTAIQSSNCKVSVWLLTAWIILLPSQVHLVAVDKWLYPVSDVLNTKGQRSWSNSDASQEAFVVNVNQTKHCLEDFQSQLWKTWEIGAHDYKSAFPLPRPWAEPGREAVSALLCCPCPGWLTGP